MKNRAMKGKQGKGESVHTDMNGDTYDLPGAVSVKRRKKYHNKIERMCNCKEINSERVYNDAKKKHYR